MSRILIAYGTTDGHTGKVAEFLGSELRRLGAEVTIARPGQVPADPRGFDAALVAASIQAGGFQHPLQEWVTRHASVLSRIPNGFVAVCLAILDPKPRARKDLDRIVDRFVTATGWTPNLVKFVPGALMYTRYGWFKRILMRWIAGRSGGSTDTSRDHVYTDWPDLIRFAAEFKASLGGPVRGPVSAHGVLI
ncbi:MAG: flavodoxin domain-containing protein [Gemmatimonadales bacterium]|nr:flavodoxin domain-containing protein [Gemmatimonadales bacterium]